MTRVAAQPHAAVDAVFDDLRRHLVEFSPVAATALGDHRRDDALDDWAPSTVAARERSLAELERRLPAPAELDGEAAGDAMLLGDALAGMRFELEDRRAHARDPLHYLDLATSGVYDLLRRDDLPAPPRQVAAAARAGQVPRLLEQARALLVEVPHPHRAVALLRLPGAVALFRDVLPRFAPQAGEAGDAAAAACERFASWLESLGDAAAPDWRLGGARWAAALRLALGVRMSADEVWDRAQQALGDLQAEAEQLAARVLGADAAGLDGDELVRRGLERCAADRSDRDTLVRDAAAALDDIRVFLRAGGDFDLPQPDTLRVQEMPPFQQGVAVAYFMPAPPLEPSAAHTYYLSPVPAAWDDERAASFLREYNQHALTSVGIHEAYPGHYVQFANALAHPRLLRRALWNAAFAEGWAVYVERQLVDAGIGDDRLRLVSVKMDMRAVANALLDQGLHVHGWDDAQALDLMVGRTYQERQEADGKLVRGKVTAGQLSTYFVGGEEMADLRRDVEAARGPAFSARAFHRDVLAQGTPPFAVLRRALLPREE